MELRRLDDRESVRGAIRAHGTAWRDAYEGLLPPGVLERVTVTPSPDEIDAWLERLPGRDDPGVAYGAAVRGSVRGYVFVRWGDTKAFVRPAEAGLKEIYVHPEWWGAGLGTSLLSAAVDAVPPGLEGLALEALAGNERGRAFYESRGFEPDGRSTLEIAGEPYETVIYRRGL